MQANKKKLWILLGALVVIVVIIVIATSKSQKTANNNQAGNTPGQTNANGTPVNPDGTPANPGANGTSTAGTTATVTPISYVSKQDLADAKAVVAGANLVTKDKTKVINDAGAVVQNAGIPNTANTVHQTALIASPADLPAEVVKIGISTTGFSPKSFTTKPNTPLTLAFTATDSSPHTIVFDSPVLSAVGVGIGPGGTRAVTFSAPAAGTYTFRCGYPGHADRGEVGTMIVK